MASVAVCDGCGAAIGGGRPEVTVVRKDGLTAGPWPMPNPDQPLEWCINCAIVATYAVATIAKKAAADGTIPAHAIYHEAYRRNPTCANKPRAVGTVGVPQAVTVVV